LILKITCAGGLMNIKRVGIIGGGQLAWMMADAAKKLEIELIIQTPSENDPAATIADDLVLAKIDDAEATAELATRCDVITFENEFVDLAALQILADRGVCFRPSLATLAPLLDKYHQRSYLQKIGLPSPRFIALESGEQNTSPFGFPVVLKARRHGYDGQGTFIIKNLDELNATCKRLEKAELLLEEFIPFDRELGVIAARSVSGEIVVYPVVETQQEEQVCRRVIAPANVSEQVNRQVESIASVLLTQLQAVGVFGIEFFLTGDGKVLVNEIAPRTHNSGHYTLDACETSQFEMLLRAVAGLPLGSPALKSAGAVMVNLLGYKHSQHDYRAVRDKIAAIPGAFVRWYGKKESRPGRKLGHITVLLNEEEKQRAIDLAQEIESIWYDATQE
jgi:5-(carboxyamino)imidazole ribonucleotide synthase